MAVDCIHQIQQSSPGALSARSQSVKCKLTPWAAGSKPHSSSSNVTVSNRWVSSAVAALEQLCGLSLQTPAPRPRMPTADS